MNTQLNKVCQISGKTGDAQSMLPAKAISAHVVHLIKKSGQAWNKDGFVHIESINKILQAEPKDSKSELIELTAEEVEDTFKNNLTFGQRMADKIAAFGGSWTFILFFFAFILIWITFNAINLFSTRFDGYPFILLNLILSCLAAVQAPIIMMSQNRKEDKDRLRAQNDYNINTKAELEIRELHLKIDLLLKTQHHKNSN